MNHTTRKLYWADAYRRRFTARVMQRQQGERPSVMLNRTLFYPTGGGQPHDAGEIAGARVLDVTQEEGLIRHYVEYLPVEDEVACEIDWPRRWDHMQQHSGQHLLSAAMLDLLGRPTVGFHLSAESVTIDVPGQPPAPAQIDKALTFVHEVLDADLPIHTSFVTPEAAANLPLRKAPTVAGLVRVVEIEGVDWSACGGTHVRSAAAIGGLAVIRLERRGETTRVHFVCGGRARADHQRRLQTTQALGAQLTTGLLEIPAAVTRLQEELSQARKAQRNLQTRLTEAAVEQAWSQSDRFGDLRLVCFVLDGDDPRALNQTLASLVERGRCVALLGWSSERPRWAAGRSADVDLDLSTLLPELQALPGVKGGGRAEMLQGGAADSAALEQALQRLQRLVAARLSQAASAAP